VLQLNILDVNIFVNIFANIYIGDMGAILVNLAVCVHFIDSYFRKLTVANNKSALKRAKIAERNRLRNKAYKSAVKTLMKKYYAALEAYTAQPTDESKQEMMARMSEAYSKIDKAVKRGVLHTNNGARKKSRLAQRLKPFAQTAA
jgi:small subunit ribosomal protein S20